MHSYTNITNSLPYTTTRDGFIFIVVSPNVSSEKSFRVLNCGSETYTASTAPNGADGTWVFPVKKNSKIVQGESLNLRYEAYFFMSL